MDLDVAGLLERLRQAQPLIHHLTNWVTISDCATVVKVLGASPVMAHAVEEVAEMTEMAQALVLNIGTLTPQMVHAMKVAARAANRRAIPVVLDACGAGATSLRERACRELLEETRIDILKGNAAEVARLAGESVRPRGVEATPVQADLAALATRLAQDRRLTVVVTGPEDLVTDGHGLWRIRNGDPLMSQVVGTGCMATSVIGAFAAVERELPLAAAAALVCFGIAGECAARACLGPGSFKECLFDYLHHLNGPTIARMQKLEFSAVSTSSPTAP